LWWKSNHPDIQMENAVKYFNNFCAYLHEKVINDRPLLASKMRFQDPNRHEISASRAEKKERIISPQEFSEILKTALNPEEALVVLIMYTMATRIDETLNLDFDGRILLDANPPLYRWTSGSNKAKKIGEHALHESLIEPLKTLRVKRMGEGTKLLFPQQKDNKKPLREQMIDWEAWRKRANLGWHWTPHTFRHTCLTNLFNDEKNAQAVICILYRTSLQVALKVYVKVTRESMLAMRDSIKVKL
jgi:integrase